MGTWGGAVLKIIFFVGSKYLLPGIKGSSKTNTPSSKYWCPVTVNFQIYDQTKFHKDHMELCFVL